MSISSINLRAVVLLALPLAPALPGPSAAQPVAATVEQCVTAASQEGRSATFSGQMSAVAGTVRMAIRIDVQERAASDLSFHPVLGPGLGVWRSSDPGVKIYKYVRQVTNMPAPASFRALVSFRWIGEKGRPVRRAHRRTAACEQPEDPSLVPAERGVRHTSWPDGSA